MREKWWERGNVDWCIVAVQYADAGSADSFACVLVQQNESCDEISVLSQQTNEIEEKWNEYWSKYWLAQLFPEIFQDSYNNA